MFKINFRRLTNEIASVSGDERSYGTRAAVEVSRQLHQDPRAEGLPEDLGEAFESILADRSAMRAAGDEIPSLNDIERHIEQGWEEEKGGNPEQSEDLAIDALFRPIITRLTRERDEARASPLERQRMNHEMQRLRARVDELKTLVASREASIDRAIPELVQLRSEVTSLRMHMGERVEERDQAYARVAKLESASRSATLILGNGCAKLVDRINDAQAVLTEMLPENVVLPELSADLVALLRPWEIEGEEPIDTLRRVIRSHETAERTVRAEPNADMVESVADVLAAFEPSDGIPQRPIRKMASAVLRNLAAMGVEALPNDETVGDLAVETFVNHANDDEDGACKVASAVLRQCHDFIAPILAAKDALLRETLAELARTEDTLLAIVNVTTSKIMPALAEHLDPATRAKGEALAKSLPQIRESIAKQRKARRVPTAQTNTRADDQPIADLNERAKAVAKELRLRGIWADVHPAAPLDVRVALREGVGFRRVFHGENCPEKGPRAIADGIQAEEARLAQAWAGDEIGRRL